MPPPRSSKKSGHSKKWSSNHAPLGDVIGKMREDGVLSTKSLAAGGSKNHRKIYWRGDMKPDYESDSGSDDDDGNQEEDARGVVGQGQKASRPNRGGLDPRMSKVVLEQARAQQRELNELEQQSGVLDRLDTQQAALFSLSGDADIDTGLDIDDQEDDGNGSDGEEYLDGYDGGSFITADQERELDMFREKRSIKDLMLAKIREHEQKLRHQKLQEEQVKEQANNKAQIDPQVAQAYAQIGLYLSRYTSGRIPKAFKILPSLKNWHTLLTLTKPENWTPNATFAATQIFAAQLRPKLAQRFFNRVLLPMVREDISKHKNLNYHLYQALKKCIFKPAAFFRGILLPLAEYDECTSREAVILSSIIARCSLPVLHSAAALHRLCELDYSGPTLLFMKTLLNKKYNLPQSSIRELVDYFHGYVNLDQQLPVVWHQALLVLVQRYKHSLTQEQKHTIRETIRRKHHHQITDEIRRELAAAAPVDARHLRQQQQQAMELASRMEVA